MAISLPWIAKYEEEEKYDHLRGMVLKSLTENDNYYGAMFACMEMALK